MIIRVVAGKRGKDRDLPLSPAFARNPARVLALAEAEAELISCRREGQFVYSEAVHETIAVYARALAKIGRGNKATRRR